MEWECVQSFVVAHRDGASDETSWSQLCTLLGFRNAPALSFQDWLRLVPTDPNFYSVERKWVYAVFDSLDDLLPKDNARLAFLNVPRVVLGVFGKEVDTPPCALAVDIMTRTTLLPLFRKWLVLQMPCLHECPESAFRDFQLAIHNTMADTMAEAQAMLARIQLDQRPPLSLESNAALLAQLAALGLTLRPNRTKAMAVMNPPHHLHWGVADDDTPVAAVARLDSATYDGNRDVIIALVGGPGTGKSFSSNQITSLKHAVGKPWAPATATAAITFNDSMNLVTSRSINIWEEVVLRMLYSHYFWGAKDKLKFTTFRTAMHKHVDTHGAEDSTVTALVRCMVEDVAAFEKTTLLLLVDELVRVNNVRAGLASELLSVLGQAMDDLNKKRRRSMMLVVASLSTEPLDAIHDKHSASGRKIVGVPLPKLSGPSAVNLVAQAISGVDGTSSAELISLSQQLVAVCGGHPRSLECACLALNEAVAGRTQPRHHVFMAAVMARAAQLIEERYPQIASLTPSVVLAMWSGRQLPPDHRLDVMWLGALKAMTVGDLVQRGVVFATVLPATMQYELSLSLVQLLAWTTTRTDPVSNLVADVISFSVADVLAGKQLERLIVAALELRMVLLVSPDRKTVVSWRQLLNIEAKPATPPRDRPARNYGVLNRKLCLPKASDLNVTDPEWTEEERTAAGAWEVGPQLQDRLKARRNKWLHPEPTTVAHFDAVMACDEVVESKVPPISSTASKVRGDDDESDDESDNESDDESDEEDHIVTAECTVFVQMKGTMDQHATGAKREWSKSHKKACYKAYDACRESHKGHMVFIAAAYMNTPKQKRQSKLALSTKGEMSFVVLNQSDCQNLMGTPLTTAFDVLRTLRSHCAAGVGAGAGAGAGAGVATSP